jgi:hypothetical protein
MVNWLFDLFRTKSEKDKCAGLVMRRMRARRALDSIIYRSGEFYLESGDKKFFLDNAYDDWQKARPEQKYSEVERYIDAWFEIEDPRLLSQTEPHLLPAVRNRADLSSYWLDPALNFSRASWDGASQSLCDCLIVALAEDRPKSLALLTREKLSEMGASYSHLLELATRNLREISPVKFRREPAGYYVSDYNDNYDAARLLLPHLFEYLDLKGYPVAIPAARGVLAVASSEETSALIAMASFAEKCFERDARRIAYQPLIFRDGQWSKFLPTDADLVPVRNLEVKQTLRDYDVHRDSIQNFCEAQGRDVWVSSLFGRYFEHGLARTYTTWTAASLLPKSDVIVLPQGDQTIIRSWDDVFKVCGQDWVTEDFYPVRYFTHSAPSDEQLGALAIDFSEPIWWKIPQVDFGRVEGD